MSHAHIIDIESAFPQIPTQFDADTGSAVPIGNVLNILGDTVANGTYSIPLHTSASGNTVTIEVQVGAAVTGAPADKNDAGIVSFDDTQFTVDANGYVQLAGGSIAIDTNTGDDAVAVMPDASGNFNWLGVTVANATHAKPVYFKDSATANALNLEVQVAADVTGAPGDKNDAGLSSYNDTQFSVDADGYVSLVGGTDLPAIQTITSDDPTAVGPDGNGNVDLNGLTVANATNAKPVYVDAKANGLDIEVQVATERTGAPADSNDAGLSSYDDTIFTVDANGYVALATTGLATTITGDSGGALSPVANNWNILGRSGSKTSGLGATLTVNSPPYSDEGGSTTVTLNSGSFATAAITLTLPASGGLADGDLCEFVATSGVLVIQMAGTQVGHLGGDSTSAGGTITGSATGDSISLRYQSSTDDWWATSAIGVWTLA